MRRPAFVLFRFLAHVACTQFEFLLALAAVVGIGAYRQVPELWAAVPLLLLAPLQDPLSEATEALFEARASRPFSLSRLARETVRRAASPFGPRLDTGLRCGRKSNTTEQTVSIGV